MQKLEFFKLWEGVQIPKFESEGAACFDLRVNFNQDNPPKDLEHNEEVDVFIDYVDIYPQSRYLFPTGLKVNIPKGYHLQVYPRSGLSTKNGIVLANLTGIIDSDYKGQLFIPLLNTSKFSTFSVINNSRVAQARLVENVETTIEEVDVFVEEFDKDERGQGGFGSTGVH